MGKRYNSYLPSRDLFIMHWQHGKTYEELSDWCKDNGILSPKSGFAPYRMTIYKCLWRWASDNFEEAKQIINQRFLDTGQYWTDEQMTYEMLKRIKLAFQSKKHDVALQKYLEKHGDKISTTGTLNLEA